MNSLDNALQHVGIPCFVEESHLQDDRHECSLAFRLVDDNPTQAKTQGVPEFRMLWRTTTNGAYRCVRFIDGFALKTPYLFKYADLIANWRISGKPKSLRWWLSEWWNLFYSGLKHNQQEVRRWEEKGTQEISGVSLCPIRFHLPLGLLVVMTKADPLGRSPTFPDEDFAAFHLIGKWQDTGKPETFGIINGKVVVVDYGYWVRRV